MKKNSVTYSDKFCKLVVEMMAEGCSKLEVQKTIGCGKKTFFEWIKVHPEFKEAVEEGNDLSEAWWTEQGRTHLIDPKHTFNHVLWYMNMKNRFGWRDSIEQKDPESSEKLDRLQEDFKKLFKKIRSQ